MKIPVFLVNENCFDAMVGRRSHERSVPHSLQLAVGFEFLECFSIVGAGLVLVLICVVS